MFKFNSDETGDKTSAIAAAMVNEFFQQSKKNFPDISGYQEGLLLIFTLIQSLATAVKVHVNALPSDELRVEFLNDFAKHAIPILMCGATVEISRHNSTSELIKTLVERESTGMTMDKVSDLINKATL